MANFDPGNMLWQAFVAGCTDGFIMGATPEKSPGMTEEELWSLYQERLPEAALETLFVIWLNGLEEV